MNFQTRHFALVTTLLLTPLARAQEHDANRDARLLAASISQLTAGIVADLPSKSANSCISPASAAMALLMVYGGAAGETAAEMAKALAPTGWSEDRIHRAAGVLHKRLQTQQEGFTLQSAQDIWLQDGRKLVPTFEQLLQAHYDNEAHVVDFAADSEQARKTINAHISKLTNERIPALLQPANVSAATRIVLTNALYLNAKWRYRFDESKTRKRPFQLLDNSRVRVPMMTITAPLPTTTLEDFDIVRLAYKDQRFAMDLVVPKDGQDSRAALCQLLQANPELEDEQLILSMPRFEISNRHLLGRSLQQQGIRRAFGGEADFSQMLEPSGEQPLQISEVIQETWIRVGEKGTEAAAATAAVLRAGSARRQQPRIVMLNRPFAFAIREVDSGLVLFAGCVNDPRSADQPAAIR